MCLGSVNDGQPEGTLSPVTGQSVPFTLNDMTSNLVELRSFFFELESYLLNLIELFGAKYKTNNQGDTK